jgi:hypothetical protein
MQYTLILIAFAITATPIPVNLAVVVPWAEVILSNLVATLKVFYPNTLRQEHSLNLTVMDVVGSEIMHKHDRLDDQTAKCGVTWQAFLGARERTLQSACTPLTCLPKRCVNIRNAEEVVVHIMMKTLRCPLCD